MPADPRRRVYAAVALLAVSLAALAAVTLAQPNVLVDVLVYRAEGRAVLDGTDLYGFTVTEWDLPATYPPFAALLFVPAAWLPLPVVQTLFAAGNTALLAWLVHLSLRLAGRRTTPAALIAATALGLWLEPVFQTFVFGQINLALTCLVLWDLTRPDGARGKGLAIGVAAGIKLTPAIFAVHLLLTGRVRAGATALAGFVGTAAVGAVVLPDASADFWTRRMFETGRVGKAWIVDNQSLQGLVARLLHTPEPGPWWPVPAAVVGLLGLWLARRAHVRGRTAWGVLIVAGTALLVSPISWSHHWVWCVPLLAVLAAAPPRGRRWPLYATAALLTARTHWLVPHSGDLDLHLPWWQQPLASPYPLLALGLIAYAARRLWEDRRPDHRTPDGPERPVPAPATPGGREGGTAVGGGGSARGGV
ncbi:glycosyltransferase 87 family protein [Streptomyces macrosporus]|uniref:glycosyltransferase 87 family protein n=1 Tax=Streptomyces macrosporus TaxID=44032 RepID=UPI003CD06D8C